MSATNSDATWTRVVYVALVSLLIREPAGPASRATVWGCTKPHVPYVEYIQSHTFPTLAPTNEADPTSLDRRSRKKQGEARRISRIKPTRVHVGSRRGRSTPVPFMVSLVGAPSRPLSPKPSRSTRSSSIFDYRNQIETTTFTSRDKLIIRRDPSNQASYTQPRKK